MYHFLPSLGFHWWTVTFSKEYSTICTEKLFMLVERYRFASDFNSLFLQGLFIPMGMFDILGRRFQGCLRASRKTKRSATRTRRAPSPFLAPPLNLTLQTLILKNSKYLLECSFESLTLSLLQTDWSTFAAKSDDPQHKWAFEHTNAVYIWQHLPFSLLIF